MAPGRKAKPPQPSRPANTLILDNGAATLKAGLLSNPTTPPLVIPNLVARDRLRKTYVGSEASAIRDTSDLALRRPVERGSIVNWEVQREIWDRTFLDTGAPLRCDPSETRLVLTEQPNNLPALQANCDQIVFEEYGFASYYRGVGSTFNAYHDVQTLFRTPKDHPTVANAPAEVMLVVDSGYSHTTVTPVLAGRAVHSAVRRLDVGGKLMTNYLARLLSLRHFDMRSETFLVNEIKEAACYVSPDFRRDVERCWKGTRGEKWAEYLTGGGIAKDYILPDFHTRWKGQLVDYDPARHSKSKKIAGSDEDALTLRNERFCIPEIAFNPSDMGMRQPGLPDLIHQSLQTLPVGLWPGLLANILVVGGNVLFDGFIQRLQKEVVQRFPDDCVVRVARPADPITSTWQGAAILANHPHIEKLVVTKKEYEELGASLVARKFAQGLGAG
ncbi:actin family [Emericellopsis atlantica]|uniref:Actin-like protein ARP6 n=1 Tax=Emericellopsis atlantica TaxID=2614577 RepID=A0A9P7ZKD0_9HYPO|nr:actin family [Emericellopsis atlantica]KAG9253714.1 actin family [Emericellopsis atlantica]